jgi:hypothetical protein
MHEDPPFRFDEAVANGVRPVLRGILTRMLDWAEARYGWKARA